MDESFPPYAFVPGGPFPHPKPHEGDPPAPVPEGDWTRSRPYQLGFALFNAGYYWEAHEAWEGLWHAHGRRGPAADLLKGLIKLAAAGVKVRQGQRHGIVTHASRAEASFESSRQSGGQFQIGLDLDALMSIAREIADHPEFAPVGLETPVARVFGFQIEPR